MTKCQTTIVNLGNACCGCGACAAVCGKNAIAMTPDEWGFVRPSVDASACVACGACERACPALSVKGDDDNRKAVYWAKAKNTELKERSSSGGLFGLLAQEALDEGGIVVGAAFSDGCHSVKHVVVEREADLDAVMRSKYVQSSVGKEVYKAVKAALRSGRRVLYSGTACQVAGMKGYLGKLANSPLLFCVDVICHGVPSPRLWSEWIVYKEKLAGSNVCSVNMRSKTSGWLSFSAMYEYIAEKDGAMYSSANKFADDWYMKAFLSNACLRPSCYECPSKRSCGSDITLGDFWGFQNIHPEVDYSKGVSAVICNSEAGIQAFDVVSDELDYGYAVLDEVVAGNPALIKSAVPYVHRDEFLTDMAGGKDVGLLVQKYGFELSFWQRVRGKLGIVKRRIAKLIGRNNVR